MNNIIADFDINQSIDADLLSQDINRMLNKLDKKYQEVLILKFLEGKSYKEISDILKKPMGTVATLVNRAKKQFRDNIDL